MIFTKRSIIPLFSIAASVVFCSAFSSVNVADAVVTVSDGVYQYAPKNGAWTLYSYEGNDTSLSLPSEYDGLPVVDIAGRCFAQSNITEVSVPDSYTEIGAYAFYGCEQLRSVSLPSSLTSLGSAAFAKSGLEQADLSDTSLEYVSDYLFMNCSSLTEITLPPNAAYVGEAAFAGTSVTAAAIPGKVTALGRAAFADTAVLSSVSLPDGLLKIGESCFENSALSDINLPETLTTIDASAFRGDSALTGLYIPDSVTEIGAYALYPMSVQSSIEVSCFKNSYAETYCYENFVIDTKAYDKIPGDANLDGTLDISDATEIQRHCATFITLGKIASHLADVNRDGTISIEDATKVQRILADLD